MGKGKRHTALKSLTAVFLCTAAAVILLGVEFERSIVKMYYETGREHIKARDPVKIGKYIRSVDKIYLTIKTVSPYTSHRRAKKLAPMFKQFSEESGIPVRTCLLIAKVESDFRQVRSKNDYGIMQINLFWLDRYNVSPEEAMDDWTNLQLFARILNELANRHLSYYHSWTPSVRAKYKERLDKWASLI